MGRCEPTHPDALQTTFGVPTYTWSGHRLTAG